MRYFCVMVLLAWTVGSTEVSVADQRQSAGAVKGTEPAEQPLADIPKEFAFLFHSPEQFTRELAKRPTHFAYVEELWKGLPYDSISFERGGTGRVPARRLQHGDLLSRNRLRHRHAGIMPYRPLPSGRPAWASGTPHGDRRRGK